MAERNSTPGESSPSPSDLPRERYSTPRLEGYGHVAKLTQGVGSTMSEAGNPAMMVCVPISDVLELDEHRQYLEDDRRMTAFANAIASTVRSG